MVAAAKAANFNALIVQVRKRGDAYYNSHIEPKASDIAADYDPLADIISQAHAVGLQVHAWLSVYEVRFQHPEAKPVGANHVCLVHPEWATVDNDGKGDFKGGRIFLDPGLPAVRDYTSGIVADIVQAYQVDGIHLDNIGYPGVQAGYNPVSVGLFNQQESRTGLPEEKDEEWCQWRRDQVTSLVAQIHATIASARPGVVLSASVPTATPDLSSKVMLEEWDAWSREQLVDFLVPMLFLPDDRMLPFVRDALGSAHSRHMYIGVGAWQIGADLSSKHVQDVRAAGAQGVVLYSYHGLTRGAKADGTTLTDLATSVFTEPASAPSMSWRQ